MPRAGPYLPIGSVLPLERGPQGAVNGRARAALPGPRSRGVSRGWSTPHSSDGWIPKPLDQSPIALVTGTVVALRVSLFQQRLQIVQHEQAAPLLQVPDQLVDALFQQRRERGGWSVREEGEAVGDHSSQGGASRTERQSTASK